MCLASLSWTSIKARKPDVEAEIFIPATICKKKQKENLKKNVKEQKLWDSEPAIMTKVAN